MEIMKEGMIPGFIGEAFQELLQHVLDHIRCYASLYVFRLPLEWVCADNAILSTEGWMSYFLILWLGAGLLARRQQQAITHIAVHSLAVLPRIRFQINTDLNMPPIETVVLSLRQRSEVPIHMFLTTV